MIKSSKKMISLFTIILTISPTIVDAGCGGWVITQVDSPVCVKEHCGIWDNTAHSQRYHAYRRCVDNGSNVIKETKTYRRHIGCGC